MKFAFFSYFGEVDNNMLETCIASLCRQAPDVVPVIITEGIRGDTIPYLTNHFNVRWICVPTSKIHKRRAACKIEGLQQFVQDTALDGDLVIVSDVDVYFQGDPFRPFSDRSEMCLGLTTRGYQHLFPINAGVFYIRVNSRMRMWLSWHVEQMATNSWEPYRKLRHRYNHIRYGLDWTVGQDFLIACWLEREALDREQGIVIEDVGPAYNYCPATDTQGAAAFAAMRRVVGDPAYPTLHLKSDLKKLIYEDGVLPERLIRHPRGKTAWM